MTAKKVQLEEILSDVRELSEKIKSLDVLPNWEQGLKNDMLRHLSHVDFGISDFIISTDEEEYVRAVTTRPKKTLRDVVEEYQESL